jgi:hypothetical protein
MASINWNLLSEAERAALLKIVSSDNALRGMPTFQEYVAAQHRMHLTAFGWWLAGFVMGFVACAVIIAVIVIGVR